MIIFSIFLTLPNMAQKKPIGIYGIEANQISGFQIKLENGGRFIYVYNILHENIVEGEWSILGDTLVLTLPNPVVEYETIIEESMVDTLNRGIKLIELKTFDPKQESLPISKASILINDSLQAKSNNNGHISIASEYLNKIFIQGSWTEFLKDSVFFIKNSEANYIKISIPDKPTLIAKYAIPRIWIIKKGQLEAIDYDRYYTNLKVLVKVKKKFVNHLLK